MLKQALELKKEIEEDGKAIVVAVSKTFDFKNIQLAYEKGFQIFGENYILEALGKMESLKKLDISWHYLGRIQSGTINKLVNRFDLIHTGAKISHLKKINERTTKSQKVLIQIRHKKDTRDYGVLEEDLLAFIDESKQLPNIITTGIMFIPPEDMKDQKELAEAFLWAKKKFNMVKNALDDKRAYAFDILSMGMSGDYKIALQNGSTHVRIGRAIFGDRKLKE